MIDFKKDPTYKAKNEPETICIPEMQFVRIDGEGEPIGEAYEQAEKIIYNLVYAIKSWDKEHKAPKGFERFTGVLLEGAWCAKSGKVFDLDKPKDWQWTIMIRVPEFVTQPFLQKVVKELNKIENTDIYEKARLENSHEGLCAQVLHNGPYEEEKATIDELMKYVEDKGYEVYGRLHEIYMNEDLYKTAPEKLKTILRYPIRKKSVELILPKI